MSDCPCDRDCKPQNMRAVLADETEVPCSVSYGGLTKSGWHEWIVTAPVTEVPIEGFEADGGILEGHVLSFVGDAWVREQERRRQAALKEADGPESGPHDEEQADE